MGFDGTHENWEMMEMMDYKPVMVWGYRTHQNTINSTGKSSIPPILS
jgi:hypothetical protein